MKVFRHVNLVLPDQIIENGVLVFDEEIKSIDKFPCQSYQSYDSEISVIDGQDGYLTPGFINIHIHGAGGKDTMDGTPEALDKISKTVINHGVTTILPTTMTMEIEFIYKALENIRNYITQCSQGAQILGANVEGPFINPEKKGAQAKKNIIKPDLKLFEDYLDIIKMMTIAPEVEGAVKLIEMLNQRGIVTSIGHSAASYKEVMEARKYGLSHTTHLYNAMTGLHHRDPGIVGAVLNSDMTCELIADLIHINPEILNLTSKVKSTDNIILITDAMEAAGLSEGTYTLGGQKVTVEEGSARLQDGRLAGSILTMDRAIKNMVKATKLPLYEVIKMATLNPAKLLNKEYKIGQLKVGLQADLVLLDKALNVKQVYIKGNPKIK